MTVYQWICVLGIPGMLAGLAAFIRLQVHQNKAMKAAVQAILRDKLLQRFLLCRLQGYATSEERQNFESMYAQYHSLGGNGVMDDVRQKFFSLPME